MDRMEIIRIPGYTEDEKIEIARRHLLPKQVKAHGLKPREWTITDDVLQDLIRYYTREAGVRNLERELANLARKAIKDIMMRKLKRVTVSRRNLEKYAGVRRFRYGEVEETDLVGVTTGLAWTEVGGELLSIEAVTLPGKGKVTATGRRRKATSSRAAPCSASRRRSSRRRTYMSTCPRERPRRTAPRPAWRWRRRSSRS
jgi:ATP-dependent Lon protease